MGHLITIESDEEYALATELAALTGESVAAAVTTAVRARLDAERARSENRAEKIRRVRAITAEMRALMSEQTPTLDMSDLYDDCGLPV